MIDLQAEMLVEHWLEEGRDITDQQERREIAEDLATIGAGHKDTHQHNSALVRMRPRRCWPHTRPSDG